MRVLFLSTILGSEPPFRILGEVFMAVKTE